MSIQDKNAMVTCPFNSAHFISRSRLMVHISRCKKNLPPNHDFVQCSYNALHYVRKGKLDEHYQECSYRQVSIANMASWDAEPLTYSQPKLIVDRNVQESTETWEDISGPSFIPENRQAEAPYMITPAGMSKAKRKEFRESERQRLRDKDSSPEKSSNSRIEPKRMKSQQEWDVEPRKPATAPNKMPGPKIAAKFSVSDDPWASSALSFDSISSQASGSQGKGRGRGRGILSWGNPGQPAQPRRCYSPDDFPDLA